MKTWWLLLFSIPVFAEFAWAPPPPAGQDTATPCYQAGLTTAEGIIKLYQKEADQSALVIQQFDTYEAVSRFAPNADETHKMRVKLGETLRTYKDYLDSVGRVSAGCTSYERTYSASDVRVMIAQVRAHNLSQDLLRRVNELRARE